MTFEGWIGPVLAAPAAGSVAGVLAWRLPRRRPVLLARSACETCSARLQPRDLVPLLSYVCLGGRCRHCGAPIGISHPAMEIAALAVAAWAATLYDGPVLWASCLLGWTLLALAVCDARSLRLPDALSLPLLLAGLGATWWFDPEMLGDHALAAAVGYLALRGLAAAYHRLRGRAGLGQGDAKLLAAAGAWLGLAVLPQVILIAAIAGLLFAAALAARGRRISARTALPFGPCLALATWLAWLYG